MERGKSIINALAKAEPINIQPAAFVRPEILMREDAASRKERLAQLISDEIVPRLRLLHGEVLEPDEAAGLSDADIAKLARLVLSPNLQAAAAYITSLREHGVTMEKLFVELLQPAAQYLGQMWTNDECDFIDVTLGVGQLQKLLAIFNCTQDLPALDARRRVFLTLAPGEQHSFGLAMVAKLLSAAGWQVTIGARPTLAEIAGAVREEWYAVAGIAHSSDADPGALTSVIAAMRRQSRNPVIGIMVGGVVFEDRPDLVAAVSADGTANNAVTAVLLAQKLFDLGARNNWAGSMP